MPSKKISEVKNNQSEVIETVTGGNDVSNTTSTVPETVEKTVTKSKKLPQNGGTTTTRTKIKKEPTVTSVTTDSPAIETQEGAGPKKVKKSRVIKSLDESEVEDKNGRRLRSFKVKLPDREEYEGRFTGLTPYQAANKALSKYFRTNKDETGEVLFTINETTRNSKKTIYTYSGKRYKLDTPVSYKITDSKDGSIREIVKNFKNSLKKIKKDKN